MRDYENLKSTLMQMWFFTIEKYILHLKRHFGILLNC